MAEVRIAQRGVDEDGAWCNRSEHIREIEWDARRIFGVDVADARHVAALTPARHIPIHVVVKGVEARTGDGDLYPLVEGGEKERIMAAERESDAANASAVDLRKRLEEVNGAHVVPNAFHRAARVAHPDRIHEVIPQGDIVRGNRHIPSLSGLEGVQWVILTNPGGPAFAAAGSLKGEESGSGTC